MALLDSMASLVGTRNDRSVGRIGYMAGRRRIAVLIGHSVRMPAAHVWNIPVTRYQSDAWPSDVPASLFGQR